MVIQCRYTKHHETVKIHYSFVMHTYCKGSKQNDSKRNEDRNTLIIGLNNTALHMPLIYKYIKALNNSFNADVLKFYCLLGELRPMLLCDPFANATAANVFSLALAAPSLLATPPSLHPGAGGGQACCDVSLQARAMEVVGCIVTSVRGKRAVPGLYMWVLPWLQIYMIHGDMILT